MPAAGNLQTLAVEWSADGVAVLSFTVSDHRHNVLTPAALGDLATALDDLAAGPPPRGVSGRRGVARAYGWGVIAMMVISPRSGP